MQTGLTCMFNAQVVDARAGPGYKPPKPKKIKSAEGKAKARMKRLHQLGRQSK